MQNFLQEGRTLTLTAPYNVNSGGGMLVGSIFAVATNAASSGANGGRNGGRRVYAGQEQCRGLDGG